METHVAREENFPPSVFDHASDGAGDVPGGVERERDFVAVFVKRLRHAERERRQRGFDGVELAVSVKRILADAQLVALAHHHADAVAQNARCDDAARRRAQHAGLRVFPQQHGKPAQMVEVAVRKHDEIDGETAHAVQLRERVSAELLRVQPAVEKDAERSYLREKTVRSDVSGAVEVRNLHSRKFSRSRRGCEEGNRKRVGAFPLPRGKSLPAPHFRPSLSARSRAEFPP